MFTQPELTTGSNTYRATTATLPPRLYAKRDGYAERTIVTSDGVRLAVRDYGSVGAREHTVVLLHGLCLTQSSWELQIRHLVRRWGKRVRIITYDHRGHGESAVRHAHLPDRQAGSHLAEVLTALRVTGRYARRTLDGWHDGAGIPRAPRGRTPGRTARPDPGATAAASRRARNRPLLNTPPRKCCSSSFTTCPDGPSTRRSMDWCAPV